MDRDQLKAALAGYTHHHLAQLLTCLVSLAAEEFPDELRAALGTVFDLKNYEEQLKVLRWQMTQTARQAAEAVDLLEGVRLDIERLEHRLDATSAEVEKVA